jgi:hypothetical protein
MLTTGVAVIVIGFTFFAICGCASIAENTNMISDEKAVSQSAGALGYSPNDLTLTDRRTEGTNTYVNLEAKDGKEFTCIINGGNMLSMGLVNPPMCGKKGEPINTNPFQR